MLPHAIDTENANPRLNHDASPTLPSGSQHEKTLSHASSVPVLQDSNSKSHSNTALTSNQRHMSPLAPSDLGQRPSLSPRSSPRRRSFYTLPTSPVRHNRPSSPLSPRFHSPASSQIFERDVQEDLAHAQQASPSIPSHLIMENHIPPVLGHSSVALTDNKLDPDSIEIVTHNLHQPAAAAAPGTGPPPSASSAHPDDFTFPSCWHDDSASAHQRSASNGTNTDDASLLDNSDTRRLSFVSFADVLHGEHAESDALSTRGSFSGLPLSTAHSPVRRSRSTHFSATPSSPSVASMSPKVTSPSRGFHSKGYASPASSAMHSPNSSLWGADLNIETMSQTLRKSESRDLSGVRSYPASAI